MRKFILQALASLAMSNAMTIPIAQEYRTRGKGGKVAHKPTGIAKIRRAARKARRAK